MPRKAGIKLTEEERQRSGPKNTDVTKLVKQMQRAPGLTTRELGQLNGVSHTAIIRLLSRHNISKEVAEEYKQGRADLFAGLQERILASVSPEDLQKASLRDKVIAAGVIYDKERLERGQSTVNAATIISASVDAGALDDDL